VLTADSQGQVRLWDLASGVCLRTFEPSWYGLADVQFTGDGRTRCSPARNC
jgi:WD40 repeat protein